MKLLEMMVIAGIIWTQVTPADKSGCAGYSPTIVDDDSYHPTVTHDPDVPYYPPFHNSNDYIDLPGSDREEPDVDMGHPDSYYDHEDDYKNDDDDSE